MNTLTVALFACLVVLASARPGIIGPAGIIGGPLGIGHAGLLGARIGLGGVALLAPDNGQWRGEGLVESQDLTGQLNALTGINDGQWRGEGLLAAQDLAGHGVAVIGAHGLLG